LCKATIEVNIKQSELEAVVVEKQTKIRRIPKKSCDCLSSDGYLMSFCSISQVSARKKRKKPPIIDTKSLKNRQQSTAIHHENPPNLSRLSSIYRHFDLVEVP
jgi:hypothetical protein